MATDRWQTCSNSRDQESQCFNRVFKANESPRDDLSGEATAGDEPGKTTTQIDKLHSTVLTRSVVHSLITTDGNGGDSDTTNSCGATRKSGDTQKPVEAINDPKKISELVSASLRQCKLYPRW